MRVVCKVLDAPTSAVAGHRSGKGAISIGTMNTPGLKTSKPCLSVFTASGKEHKYPLDGTSEVATVHDKFISQGKVTIVWKNPLRTTMISEARPEVLRNLVHKLQAVLKGENIETLKEITKEKKSDMGGQVALVVRKREEYPKTFPSASLKSLCLSGIGLKRVDGRWFTCTLLTTLDLSRNLMSTAPDIVKMKLVGRLVNLQVLNLSHNRFHTLPTELLDSLPPSLLALDLSYNSFHQVPSLSSVPSLTLLNMAHNRLTILPKELRFRRTLSLNLDHNQIKFIPYMLSSTRLNFSVTGNPLDEPLCKPKLSSVECPSMLQWAMQSIERNRIRLEAFLKVRFWEEEGIDFCDYCRVSFATNFVFPFVQAVDASMLSSQAAFNTRYPSKTIACRKCYLQRNRRSA
ncbi:lrr-1 [Pristionchus pacificus]|nr:lrr-1 [Pristionchus pacificus]